MPDAEPSSSPDTPVAGRRQRLRLVSIIRRAIRLVWRAAPGDLTRSIVYELIAAAALAVTLLAGREVVTQLTLPESPDTSDVLPSVLVLGAALVVSGVAQVAVRETRALIAERTVRATQEEIADIATSVDFERFESAEFHDLLQRANSQVVQSSTEKWWPPTSPSPCFWRESPKSRDHR